MIHGLQMYYLPREACRKACKNIYSGIEKETKHAAVSGN